jgi:protein-tyrosine phosphatase
MPDPTGPSQEQQAVSLVGAQPVMPLRVRLRRLASRIRRFPERALHPLRRRKARQIITTGSTPTSILVLCYGNVCRSPYAAHAIVRALPEPFRGGVSVTSAGFVGPGRGSPADAVAVARRLGIDLTEHRSQVITPDSIAAADLVLVMDGSQQTAVRRRFSKLAQQVLVLGDFDPQPIEKRAIRDPWNQPVEVFDNSYRRIDRCVAEFVAALTGGEESRPSPR